MSPETQTSRHELTRKQKLARRLIAPVALIAAGGAVAYGTSDGSSPETQEHAEAYASATVRAEQIVEFGGDSDTWGHDTAERAIKLAVKEGLNHVGASTSNSPFESLDIKKLIDELPVYEQADKALEMAGYGEVLPDVGDKLAVEVDVTVDSNHALTYEVIDADIKDLPNNQS